MTDDLPEPIAPEDWMFDDCNNIEIVCTCTECGDEIRCIASDMTDFPDSVRDDHETVCPDCVEFSWN